MRTKAMVFGLLGIISLILVSLAFSQQDSAVTAAATPAVEEVSWVWGEVKSVDPAGASVAVTYMDYQTDEEKDLALNIDSETKYENVAGLSDIKAGDTASIDYVIKDGKNIARNISIEKTEEMPEAPTKVDPAQVKAPEAPVEAAGVQESKPEPAVEQ